MNNQNKVLLASGIIFGLGAVYAYKNHVSYDDVIDQLASKQEKFNEFIRQLISICYETLVKLFNIVVELVRQVAFQIKLCLN